MFAVSKIAEFGRYIKLTLSNFWDLVKPEIIRILLAPVAVMFGWGPITHIYFNKTALDRVEKSKVSDPGLREILDSEKLRKVFIDGSNSVDLIKANNLRNRERFFEYAHNTIPSYFDGQPVMGLYLIDEVKKSGDNPVNRAWSYAWLSHQLVDGFAHKIPHAGCEGWVNSRRILSGYYKPVIEDELAVEFDRRIKMYIADHWLAEMLTDLLCYSRDPEYFENLRTDLRVPTNGEVLKASTRILDQFEKELGPGYVYFEPLTDKKLKAIVDYYHLIILCSLDVYRAILKEFPGVAFEEYIANSPRMSRLNELIDCSINSINEMFIDPQNPWKPSKYLPESENGFLHSVYEYERDWRPGNYNFGRKTGLVGALYYNPATDMMISAARNIALSQNLWPVINLGMKSVYGKGRGQWGIASAFISAMIEMKPKNIPETMEIVASKLGLEKYEEIVPD